MSKDDFKERVKKGWLVAEGVFGERPPEGQENGLLSDMVMTTAYAYIWSRPDSASRSFANNLYCAGCSRA